MAAAVAMPLSVRIHEPTLIGEVTLNIRSMLRNRAGFPRSEVKSAGLSVTPTNALAQARRARTSLPRNPDRNARPALAPAIPPVKK